MDGGTISGKGRGAEGESGGEGGEIVSSDKVCGDCGVGQGCGWGISEIGGDSLESGSSTILDEMKVSELGEEGIMAEVVKNVGKIK